MKERVNMRQAWICKSECSTRGGKENVRIRIDQPLAPGQISDSRYFHKMCVHVASWLLEKQMWCHWCSIVIGECLKMALPSRQARRWRWS